MATDKKGGKRASPKDGHVHVRALKTFRSDIRDEGTLTQPGTEIEIEKRRASELRANGIVEFVDDADEAADEQAEAEAAAEGARVRRRART